MGGGSWRPIRSNMKYSGVSTRTPQMAAIQNTILANFISFPRLPRPALARQPRAAVPTWPDLFAADREAVDAQRRRGHGAAELEIVGDFGDVEEDFFQVSGHGDFFDRVGEFSA